MQRPKLLVLASALVCATSVLASACAESPAESVLQASDLVTLKDAKFDANAIMDLEVFEDSQSFDVTALQAFLERTPYRRPSFLATYQSNGIRASDALYRAAVANRINPFVMIVRAQALQGLIGTQFYPFPPSRVEYVFRCGCSSETNCSASLAGFDRQANCLARKLRQSLDEITANGTTAGSWGPGKASVTLEGQSITPKDASTAALYQDLPLVGINDSGSWLFWNIWQNYAEFLGYFGPSGGRPQGGWIGDACRADGVCTAPNSLCVESFPGGMCTATCTDTCPSDPSRAETFCADFGAEGGYCLPKCNPGVPGACRTGYSCQDIYQFGSKTVSANVCVKTK